MMVGIMILQTQSESFVGKILVEISKGNPLLVRYIAAWLCNLIPEIGFKVGKMGKMGFIKT